MTLNIFHMASYPYYAGGIDTWLNNFLKSNNIYDEDVRLICFDKTSASAEIPVFEPPENPKITIHYVNPIKGKLFLFWNILKYCADIILLLFRSKKTDINFVLSTLPILPLIVVMKKLMLIRGKLVCSVRGQIAQDCIDLKYNSYFCYVVRKAERFGLLNCDQIFSNGWDTQKYLLEMHALQSVVIPNAVDDRFQVASKSPSSKCRICHIGTLRPVKNIDIILKSFARLSVNERDQIELTFAGKGDELYYQQIASELNINVKFIGHKNDVALLLKECDFVVNYSGGSGVSNSLIEALACGRPVIAPKKFTFEQVLSDGINGILCEGEAISGLTQGFKRALLEKKRYDPLTVSDSVKDFRWKKISLEWQTYLADQ